MNKKVILVLSLIASGVLLTSVWITMVQSAAKDSHIPTEWYQTVPSSIIAEKWNWDWTGHEEMPLEGAPYFFYKKVGDAVFLTYPDGPLEVADRVGQTQTWATNSKPVGAGPPGNDLLTAIVNTTITFTTEDIPLTDEDNDYKGLRLVIETWIDAYRLENIDGGHLWQGWIHQHWVSWAPKGSRA